MTADLSRVADGLVNGLSRINLCQVLLLVAGQRGASVTRRECCVSGTERDCGSGPCNDDFVGIVVILLNMAMFAAITVDHRLNFKGVFAASLIRRLRVWRPPCSPPPGDVQLRDKKGNQRAPPQGSR